MHLARLKFNPMDTRQYPQISRGLPIAVLLKAAYCPISKNREINFPFWNSFMTLMYCNYEIALQLRRLLLPIHKMRLLCNLKTWTHRNAKLWQFKLPKLVIIKQGRPNPLSQCQIVIMLWVPHGGMRESALGVNTNFCLPLCLIISLFLSDPNLTGISTSSLRHSV